MLTAGVYIAKKWSIFHSSDFCNIPALPALGMYNLIVTVIGKCHALHQLDFVSYNYLTVLIMVMLFADAVFHFIL